MKWTMKSAARRRRSITACCRKKKGSGGKERKCMWNLAAHGTEGNRHRAVTRGHGSIPETKLLNLFPRRIPTIPHFYPNFEVRTVTTRRASPCTHLEPTLNDPFRLAQLWHLDGGGHTTVRSAIFSLVMEQASAHLSVFQEKKCCTLGLNFVYTNLYPEFSCN